MSLFSGSRQPAINDHDDANFLISCCSLPAAWCSIGASLGFGASLCIWTAGLRLLSWGWDEQCMGLYMGWWCHTISTHDLPLHSGSTRWVMTSHSMDSHSMTSHSIWGGDITLYDVTIYLGWWRHTLWRHTLSGVVTSHSMMSHSIWGGDVTLFLLLTFLSTVAALFKIFFRVVRLVCNTFKSHLLVRKRSQIMQYRACNCFKSIHNV